MSDKKTKAELLEMLAEAVRNTQPRPVGAMQREPEPKMQPRKTRPASKRTDKIKSERETAGGKQRGRR